MNDQVEAIFTQMFAPGKIPQSVVDMYDRTKFLADKVDAPIIPVSGLVLIAASATKTAVTSLSKPIDPAEVDTKEVSETLPVQPDEDVQSTAPETPVEQTSSDGPMDAPRGAMDAPTTPEPELQRGMSEKRLMMLTAAELRAHALEFYGLKAKATWGKKKIVHTIQEMNPIKPGAQAKHPSEAKEK